MFFGGILRIYAKLRRDFVWGEFKLEFFEIVGVGPRGWFEEGGPISVNFGFLGEFYLVELLEELTCV
jgi:hypothetical protein